MDLKKTIEQKDKEHNPDISDDTKNTLIEGLKMTEFKNEERFLMKLHNLIVKEVHEKDNNTFFATITVPEGFDRPHLAGIDFEKISLELIKEINKLKGIEKSFSKNFLYESSIVCKKEIKDVSEMKIKLIKGKDLQRESINWQTWSFDINDGSMKGKCTVKYFN